MRQIRMLVVIIAAGLTFSRGLRGLVIGLTIVAVNELGRVLLDLFARHGRRRAALPDWWTDWWRRSWNRLAARFLWWRNARPSSVVDFPRFGAIASDLAGARYSRRDFDLRMRRRLLEIAAVRLADRHGVDIDSDRSRAAELLGEDSWELLDPVRPPADDRSAPGVDGERMDRLVRRLEALGVERAPRQEEGPWG